ncbi:hypothetical protein H0H92_004702, partial [Tricholoma furcatifolium]
MAPRTRPTQQLPPGLQTRAANKNVHPVAAAGVAPKPRGTRAEQRDNRDRREKNKAEIEHNRAQARARAAQVEDNLQAEDKERDAEALRPRARDVAVFRAPSTNTIEETTDKQRRNKGNGAITPQNKAFDTQERT